MKHCQRYARLSLPCVPLTGPSHTSDDDIDDGNDDDLDELIEVTSSSQTWSWLQTINDPPSPVPDSPAPIHASHE